MFRYVTKFKVKDFDAWKKIFDESSDLQKKAGLHSFEIYRCADDPNEITLIVAADDAEKAMAFFRSTELQEGQKRAGVISKPESYQLESM